MQAMNIESTETLNQTLRQRLGQAPAWCVVAGSGLSAMAGLLADSSSIPYAQLPGFPRSTVAGHAGRLTVGTFGTARAAFFCGRTHVYERGTIEETLTAVRAAADWGCRTVVLTNAAGALNPQYRPGDLMLIADQINWMFRQTQSRPEQPLHPLYDPTLRRIARQAALSLGLRLHEGVYAANLGPTFETPAEARLLRKLEADAVGMSTAHEALAARQRGLRVMAISYIANSLVNASQTTHEEVLANATQAARHMGQLLEAVMGTE